MRNFTYMLIVSAALLCGMVSTTHAQTGEAPNPFDMPTSNVTVDGTLLKIEGEYYVVQDMTGREVRLHVNESTMLLGGRKQAGDRILAEVTVDGHAIAIQ